jgi:hypothetical protein
VFLPCCSQASVALRRLESFLLAKEVVEVREGGAAVSEGATKLVLPRLHDPASVAYHRAMVAPLGDATPLVKIEGERDALCRSCDIFYIKLLRSIVSAQC